MNTMPKPTLPQVLVLIRALSDKIVDEHLTSQSQQDQGSPAERTKPVPLRDLDRAA